jgi:hypothetical protein
VNVSVKTLATINLVSFRNFFHLLPPQKGTMARRSGREAPHKMVRGNSSVELEFPIKLKGEIEVILTGKA